MQSVGLMAVHQKKLDRYSLLAALAERQVLDGLRAVAPVILPVAVSTHGEFCPGAVRVQEWLTSKYRERLLLEGDRDDGEKLEDLTAAFRGELRSSLLVASCKGLADMILAAGLPFAVNGNSARGVGARARSPSAPPSRGSLSRPRSPSPEEGLDLAGDPSIDQCSTASSSEDENFDASDDDAVTIADDSAHNRDDDDQEAITLPHGRPRFPPSGSRSMTRANSWIHPPSLRLISTSIRILSLPSLLAMHYLL